MPKAIEPITTSRRALLAGSSAALAVTAAPLAKADAANPDAELLAMIDAFRATREETTVILDAVEDLPAHSPEQEAAWTRHWDVLSPLYHDLKWRIATTPARTREGLLAKAKVAGERYYIVEDASVSGDDALAVSVIRDVLGLPPCSRPAGEA